MMSRNTFDFWRSFFDGAFRDLHDDIVDIMEASGSSSRFREGWLQGELYLRALRNGSPRLFPWPNCRLPSYGKDTGAFPDFAFYSSDEEDADLLAIGELKVLASDFQSKMFCGAPLGPWLAALQAADSVNVDETSLPLINTAADSLLGDWHRLRTYAPDKPDVVRFIVLVFLDRSEDHLGRLLRTLRIGEHDGAVHQVRLGRGATPDGTIHYRLWSVPAQLPSA